MAQFHIEPTAFAQTPRGRLMPASWPLFAVLGSAFVYTIAALCIKRALSGGATVWQVNFAANMAMALLYLPFWVGVDFPRLLAQGYKPIVAAITFFVGQLFTFAALRKGDVSVATPLLGAKVIFVAFLTSVLFGEAVGIKWWLAALICTLGIFLVTGSQRRTEGWTRHSGATAAYSLVAALAYALTDTVLQHWSPEVGVVNFVAVMFSFTGILTCALYVPAVGWRRLVFTPAHARKALLLGALLLALQNLVVTLAIRFSGDATAVNIVYSSRCVLSVVMAWATARWLGSREATLPRTTLLLRLAGALLLAAAILMVLL
ncbi:MAG TPA: DMT family transporter [Terrimicrobiaceae bacterium]|nr:DMT family transporter [Terrimicrobiaceae bacterium]